MKLNKLTSMQVAEIADDEFSVRQTDWRFGDRPWGANMYPWPGPPLG
jgi:hypothetical protein